MKFLSALVIPCLKVGRLNFSVMATIKAKVRKEIDLDISAAFTDKARFAYAKMPSFSEPFAVQCLSLLTSQLFVQGRKFSGGLLA